MKCVNEISTLPFQMTPETHSLLKGWLSLHVMKEAYLDELPKLGLVVSFCGKPVGAAFLKQIEGGKGLIDSFIANPECEAVIRTRCLDQLILDLITLAKFSGMTGLIGLTLNKRVIQRAKKLGFSLMDHSVVTLKL